MSTSLDPSRSETLEELMARTAEQLSRWLETANLRQDDQQEQIDGLDARVQALGSRTSVRSGPALEPLEQYLRQLVHRRTQGSRGGPDSQVKQALQMSMPSPSMRTQIAERLDELVDELESTDDPYTLLDALRDLRYGVDRAVRRSRSAGARQLGQALFMLREALRHVRAEELQREQVGAMRVVIDTVRAGDPGSKELRRVDEALLSVGLDWVPTVPSEGMG